MPEFWETAGITDIWPPDKLELIGPSNLWSPNFMQKMQRSDERILRNRRNYGQLAIGQTDELIHKTLLNFVRVSN